MTAKVKAAREMIMQAAVDTPVKRGRKTCAQGPVGAAELPRAVRNVPFCSDRGAKEGQSIKGGPDSFGISDEPDMRPCRRSGWGGLNDIRFAMEEPKFVPVSFSVGFLGRCRSA